MSTASPLGTTSQSWQLHRSSSVFQAVGNRHRDLPWSTRRLLNLSLTGLSWLGIKWEYWWKFGGHAIGFQVKNFRIRGSTSRFHASKDTFGCRRETCMQCGGNYVDIKTDLLVVQETTAVTFKTTHTASLAFLIVQRNQYYFGVAFSCTTCICKTRRGANPNSVWTGYAPQLPLVWTCLTIRLVTHPLPRHQLMYNMYKQATDNELKSNRSLCLLKTSTFVVSLILLFCNGFTHLADHFLAQFSSLDDSYVWNLDILELKVSKWPR
jgi:hypothetical protein